MLMWVFLGVAALAISLSVIVFLVITAYIYSVHYKYSHLPSPKLPSFYLGHLSDLLRAQKETKNDELPFFRLYEKWYHDSGSTLYVVFMLHQPLVATVDPDYINQLCMQPGNGKPRKIMRDNFSYLFGVRFLGNSLLTIPDFDTWRPRRKLYDPAFKKGYLQSLVPAFNECVNTFIDDLRPLADGRTVVSMKTHLSDVTRNVISKVAFGEDFDKTWESGRSLSFLVTDSFLGLYRSLQLPWYKFVHPLETQQHRDSVTTIRAIGRDCIRRRIAMLEGGGKVPNDILTHILRLASTEEIVDIEELVDDFVVYYIAGQETTSNLLTFSVILTHQHPLEAERLQAEVTEVLGSRQTVSFEDLEKLEYTEQFLLEALRTYPPVPSIFKETPTEGLTLGDYHIPGQTTVSMPGMVACHLPQFIDDPDSFRPSRFNQENKQPNSFVYFPFGLGHRSCIGKHFAMTEAKIVMARLFQTFQVTLPADYNLFLVQRGTLQSKDNVPCTLVLRQ